MGTLFPLLVAAALVNGLSPQAMLLGAGLFYIASSLYYRLPLPVQPLKAALSVAIAVGLPAATVGAAGLLMGAILLFLAATNLITLIARWFPRSVVRGIQLGVGLLLVQKGATLMVKPVGMSPGVSVGDWPVPWGLVLGAAALAMVALGLRWKAVPSPLAILGLGLGLGIFLGPGIPWSEASPGWPGVDLPGGANFLSAFLLLVIPQLPLTLGNSVVATADTAVGYFGPRASRVTPRALATGIGLANLGAGLAGAMPMCQGSGGVTAHYKLGARTGGATLMFGGLLVAVALLAGSALLPLLSLIPLSILGGLLVAVGGYHAFLARDLPLGSSLLVAFSVALVSLLVDNLAVGFGVGIALHYGLQWWKRTRQAI